MPSRPAATAGCRGTRSARTTAARSRARAACRSRCRTRSSSPIAYLDLLDGLVVTGGAFDLDPALYGDASRHPTVRTKDRRTAFELGITQRALARDLPLLGICGGQQLLNVALGGDLIQHIPDAVPGCLAHEQPNPRTEPGHAVEVVPGTRLFAIGGGCARLEVNSAHHQAAGRVGPGVVVSGRAPDGVIEAIEAPDAALLPRRAVASGIRHLGRRRSAVRRADRGLPPPMSGTPPEAAAAERVAKRIARAGLCSRRDAERWIADGRVAVDGEVLTSPAVTVTEASLVTVDGVPLPAAGRARLFRYHKPAGVLTAARDPEGRPTIYDRLPPGLPRLMPVGRLDLTSEGLLLLTNDGALKRALELPATGWVRRYRARVHGTVDEQLLAGLAKGITLDGFKYGPIEASLERVQGSNAWLKVALREGKNREIRRVLEHFGWPVTRLIRLSFGPFQLGHLKPGEVDELTGKVLREQLGESLAGPPEHRRRRPTPR